MCLRIYSTRIFENLVALKKFLLIFMFPICLLFPANCTTVNFIVINEENRIFNFDNRHLQLEECILEYDSLNSLYEEDKFSILKNNIICFKSISGQHKYYNPEIVTIPYNKNTLLNSNVLKKIYESKQIDIRIILKDITYRSLQIFLKSLEYEDSIVNKFKIQDFLDILTIISLLDIENTKEITYYIKELFRHLIFEMINCDFEKYRDSLNYKKIKKPILIDLWILFMNIITFADKNMVRQVVLSDNRKLSLKKIEIFLSARIQFMPKLKFKLYLRFNTKSIGNLYKIYRVDYLMRTLHFLFKITNLDILYLIFGDEESYAKSIKIFSNISIHTKKLYLYFFKEPINLFINKNGTFFSKSFNILKIKYNFTSEEMEPFLVSCSKCQKITLLLKNLDSNTFELLIKFARNNPDIFYKVFYCTYILENITYDLLRSIPNNIIFYVNYNQTSMKYQQIPLMFMPFFNNYAFYYKHKEELRLPTDFIFFECSKIKDIKLDYKLSDSPFKLDDTVFTSLRYLKTIKCLSLENIVISKELLFYILESNTLIQLIIKKFICKKLEFLSDDYILYNFVLNHIRLEDSLSFIDSNISIFLNRFKKVVGLMFINADMYYKSSYLYMAYSFFVKLPKKQNNKTYLKRLEIQSASNNKNTPNILNFLSEIYIFTKLSVILYNVNQITELEYQFFSKMPELEAVFIEIRNRTNLLNFQKLFSNLKFNRTKIILDINVGKIQKEDVRIFSRCKHIANMYLSCDSIDYETVASLKKNDFKNTIFKLVKPTRAERSNEINNYLDSEFEINYP
ncbi:hypothetical protein CWI37_0422p0020 [Hamiltosporidium tvaerminnensis]|uniref:Uncharacterized protein n=1 Tax=Hamiltosporidium tvaerminnensis TaxID=1176355 RepID=A0A4Q9L771_9MICR|nr:hypothetical protein LUQ84_002965 [Hamiltosporidium tvaerminnensis]TBU02741.1 hypothetical protein CWI37_0422p0020 [Hamiltosporidium tvaerminnensis]